MASEIQNDLAGFYRFVGDQLDGDQFDGGQQPPSPEECLQKWRALHPSSTELEESVAAVKRALDQADSGDGKTQEQFDRDFRGKHGLPQDA